MARAVPRRALLAACVLIAAGCSMSNSTAPSSASPAAWSTEPASVTAMPASDAPSNLAPTTAAPASADPNAPPTADLIVDGRRYPGTVGGYTWGAYSQSAPWHPATGLAPIAVSADAELSAQLDGDPAGIDSWAARIADATDPFAEQVMPLRAGETPPVSIVALPAGDWVLELRVVFADGNGDGAYYWHVVVR